MSDFATDTVAVTAPREPRGARRGTTKIKEPIAGRLSKWLLLAVVAVVMLVPLYIMVISAFKPAADILLNPLGFSPGSFTFEYLARAATSEA